VSYTYAVTVEVHRALPSMDVIVDAIADELERRGYSPNGDYEVLVHGPPQMKIVVTER